LCLDTLNNPKKLHNYSECTWKQESLPFSKSLVLLLSFEQEKVSTDEKMLFVKKNINQK